MLHPKTGNNYNTAIKIFLAVYIKLCYDLCDTFLEFLYNNSHYHYRALSDKPHDKICNGYCAFIWLSIYLHILYTEMSIE